MTKKKGLQPRLFIDESSSLYAGLAALEPALIRSRLIYLAKLGLQAENELLNRNAQVGSLRGHSDKFNSTELIEEVNSNSVPDRHSCPKIINRHITVNKQPTAVPVPSEEASQSLFSKVRILNCHQKHWAYSISKVRKSNRQSLNFQK